MSAAMFPKIKTEELSGIEKRILCARFYESIKAFYEDPENQRRFEEWQARKKQGGEI